MEEPRETKQYQFQFTGAGGEYFKIWLVNILLTIITLGIYSAWAKVRTNRYFYGNTTLHQASFEYLATPMQILKGRLIAVAIFILYNILSSFNPIIGLVLLVIFLFAIPYLIVRAITFQHRMTAYKNIRFDFNGNIGGAFMVYFVWPILSAFTFGLLYPFVHKKLINFYISNSQYGQASFDNTASVSDFYKLYLILFGIVIAMGAIFLVITSTFVELSSLNFDPEQLKEAGGSGLMFMGALYGAMFVFYFVIISFMSSIVVNLMMNTTTLDKNVRFKSHLSLPKMAWILFSNALLILFTLGFAYPWTMVRLAHYRANHTVLTTTGTLDDFLGSDVAKSNSFGEEMGEVFDIDVGV